eukprot:g47719.t1
MPSFRAIDTKKERKAEASQTPFSRATSPKMYGGQQEQGGRSGGYGEQQHGGQRGQQPLRYAQPTPFEPADTSRTPLYKPEDYSDGAGGERMNYEEGQFRDVIWLVLFLMHLGGMIFCAITYIPDFYGNLDFTNNKDNGVDEQYQQVAWITAGTCVVAGVMGAVWLGVMQRYASSIIKVSLMVNVTLLVFMGLMMFAYVGNIIGAFLYWLLAGLTLLYYYAVRNRIPFTQAVLASATEAIKTFSGPVYVAWLCCFLQVVWFGFWAFTATAIVYSWQEQGEDANGGLVFLLLVSAYWTSQVIINIGHVTTAGVVATWWFVPHNTSPTCGSFKRATTTSLGSICFGSLIVAILKALHAMVAQARQTDNNCARCMAECILSCLEQLIEYFNMYAYTQVAIYGKDFRSAAKDTWDLFKARGFTAIINDDLTGMVLTMGCFIGAVVSAASGALVAMLFYQNSDLALAVGIAGFLIGFFVVAVIMNVIQSAVCTTFVCWAEDAAACAAGRPQWFARILDASRAMYPAMRL